ncbi:MAG TPA: MFS transporter [Paenirhodobacter sp.]
MTDSRPASWTAFILVSIALASGTMGATMASPLFPLYGAAWGITHTQVTVLYVVYMIGVLGAFQFLGSLPDRFGPIRVLRGGTVLLLVGLVLSAMAPAAGGLGTQVLGVARLLIGIASGMVTTAATLGLLEVEPGAPKRAPIVTSAVTMAGFGAGPLVSGLIAEFAPWPLVMPYLAIALPILAVMVGLCKIRARHAPGGPLSFRPHLGLPSRGALPGFIVVSLSVFSAYALFSLLASLAPSFLSQILPWSGPAITGTAVAVVLFCSALVQIPARRLPPQRTLPIALCLMAGGVAVLALAVGFNLAAAFVIADLAIGMGHGLSFLSGVMLVNAIAGRHSRAGIFATFFSIAYLGAIVPIIAVGRMADRLGLVPAVIWYSLVFAVFCLGLLSLVRRTLAPGRLEPLP